MSCSTHNINNINVCKKVLIQYEPPSTHIHAQRNTHTHDATPQKHALQHMTTSQHRSLVITLHDKYNTQTVTLTTACYKKIYGKSIYTQRHK
jgi:hypothetical protein